MKRRKNKWYPLPPDYGDLTRDGQRKARLAVLKDHSSPDKLVEAWQLFRRLYLQPRGRAFYRTGFTESPPLHGNLVWDLGMYARNVEAAPRGSAKSTVIGKEIPILLALTRPYFDVAMGLATDRLVEDRFDTFMDEFAENPQIIEDFGQMKPKRGQAVWNRHHLHLGNGSHIRGFSVTGRKRGARPTLFILDDPEFDEEVRNETSSDLHREKFERLLFREIIPMLQAGCGIFWIGTMINRRCYLYHACTSSDRRFKHWNRRVVGASDLGWRDNPSFSDEFLAARKSEIGAAAYSAEYENKPSSEQSRLFVIHPRLNEYTCGLLTIPTDPLNCTEKVKWWEKSAPGTSPQGQKYVERYEPMNELFEPMFRICTLDYASGRTVRNDYSCIAALGFDTTNCLWILDLWLGRVRESKLIETVYKMGYKWNVRGIGVEAASIQVSLVDAVEDFVNQQVWRPRVVPITYPANVTKAERIAQLDWRFETGRIKYPKYVAEKFPFKVLYAQTKDFTKDLALLPHDDAIDTVAMSQFMIHAKGTKAQQAQAPPSLADRIRRNKPVVQGLPLLSGVNISELGAEEMEALLDKAHPDPYNRKQRNRRLLERIDKFGRRRRPNIYPNYDARTR